jgi:putative Ca2+/H+ antiporter (TMEM165/GDT1 family)
MTTFHALLLGPDYRCNRRDSLTGMNKQLFTVFLSVFIAEIGDKTQLATMLFATEQNLSPFKIFLASSAALVTSSAIAVLAGSAITRVVPVSALKIVAGLGFLAIGIWTLVSAKQL